MTIFPEGFGDFGQGFVSRLSKFWDHTCTIFEGEKLQMSLYLKLVTHWSLWPVVAVNRHAV